MVNVPFASGGADGDSFDGYDEFVPEHLPDPGPFLEGHDVLAGDDHVEFHRTTRDLFDERSVYDMTFGYNLARLNVDARHPDAGYRYAEQADDPAVLRAEFTPTTAFCPQTHTLTTGSFRAWNAEPGRHDYDLVAVRVAPMHHRSESIDEHLADLEARFRETGDVRAASNGSGRGGSEPAGRTGATAARTGTPDGARSDPE